MDKKEFIFPGIVLGLVLIIAIGLLLTQGNENPQLPSPVATSTATSTSSGGKDSAAPSVGVTHYYPYGTTVLSLNQVAGFKNAASIRPVAVLEDSRCPAGVQCIQAGTVNVSMRVSANGSTETKTVSLGKTITVGGLSITLTSVEPVRQKDAAPAQSAYHFTFTVVPATTVATPVATGPCYVGGCSSEICSDTSGQVSSCIYRSEYACYKKTTCERQSDGKCGWTENAALTKCLANPDAAV